MEQMNRSEVVDLLAARSTQLTQRDVDLVARALPKLPPEKPVAAKVATKKKSGGNLSQKKTSPQAKSAPVKRKVQRKK